MKRIKLENFFNILINDVFIKTDNLPIFYLQDGDCNYHKISEVDLYRDRICCEDGYFDYYEYLFQSEYEEDGRIFIGE